MSPLSFGDLGFLIFGGDVVLQDGSAVTLEPAFDMCFDSPHLRQARERCGYLPSTRSALNDKKVRHEVIESAEDGGNEEEAINSIELDPIGSLYKIYEEQNHEAVQYLLSEG